MKSAARRKQAAIPALNEQIEKRLHFLRGSDLLSALPAEDQYAVVAAMQSMRYENGAFIIRQDEPGNHLHLLTSGQAEARVRTAGNLVVTVATFQAGDCFGEMSLLSGDLTSADVVAVSEAETLALDRRAFNSLIAANPGILREFVRMISRRLRITDAAVGAARQKQHELTRFLQEEISEQSSELVGKHPSIKELQKKAEDQARRSGPVLIQGERGTGKELVARLIHFRGARKDGPLLSSDCAQITETQWGDSLFGEHHELQNWQPQSRALCYMDLAEGGTLLLKNIELLPPAIQDRLARFLEGGRPRFDVRIITTCRSSLNDRTGTVHVSPALAKALSEHVIVVPSLRERKKDVPELATYFVRRYSKRLAKPVSGLDDQAICKLVCHDYLIGNVQELEEAIERAVILTDSGVIESEEIFLGPPPRSDSTGFNLLALPKPVVRLALRLFPATVQRLLALLFAFILYECFFVPAGPGGNLGTLLVWALWWPALMLSLFFAGRAWCAVCPMGYGGSLAKRMKTLERRIPGWLKTHDSWIAMAGFFLIIWAEEVTGMRHAPVATGVLLLFILSGAVLTSILFPRSTWCRHICPLGGFAGMCSTSSMLELRPTLDICSAKCQGHSCYKGDANVPGCPIFNHVMFLNSNQHCLLCMNCVRSCPNNSPRLTVRMPARELWSPSVPSGFVPFAAMLAGLLAALTFIHALDSQSNGLVEQLSRSQRVILVSGMLAAGAGLPLLVLWLMAVRLRRSSNPEAASWLSQTLPCWMPLLGSGFFSYEMAFLPGLSSVRVTFDYSLSDAHSFSFAILPLLQVIVLSAGLAITLAALWKRSLAVEEGGRWCSFKKQAPPLEAAAYWMALVLMLSLG